MVTDKSSHESLRQEYQQARGYFSEWNQLLLDRNPDLLRDVMQFAVTCEGGHLLSDKLRHLIWLALDSAITHTFPFGIELHARLAKQCGASDAELFETLRLGCASNTSVAHALALVGPETGKAVQEYRAAWSRLSADASSSALGAQAREIIQLALAASPAGFDAERVVHHAESARAAGASEDELVEAVMLASGIGIHGLISALPLVAPVLDPVEVLAT